PRLCHRDRLFWIMARQVLAPLAQRPAYRAARHRRALASPMAATPLDGTITAEGAGSPEDRRGDSDAGRYDGVRKSSLGRAAHPWGIAQAGRRRLGANR